MRNLLDTIVKARELAARPSYERARAEAMGFTFGEVAFDPGGPLRGVDVRVPFRCVCGTQEMFRQMVDVAQLDHWITHQPEKLDFAAELRRIGSFDRDHLLADRYAPAEVDRIVALGEAFDRSAVYALESRGLAIRESINDAMREHLRNGDREFHQRRHGYLPAKAG